MSSNENWPRHHTAVLRPIEIATQIGARPCGLAELPSESPRIWTQSATQSLLLDPQLCSVPNHWNAGHAAVSALWLCIIAHSALSAYCDSPQYGQFEREILRERVRAGLDHARSQGKRLGRPPTAVVKAGSVRDLFRTGISKSEIARRLRIGRTSVRRILADQNS